MSYINVNSLNTNSARSNKIQERQTTIKVKSGETLTQISRRFGMTPNQFKTWTGLEKSQLEAGQVIALPMAEVPKGKGIYALAREYSMTIDEFTKLNNISKDYSAKAGEKFYVVKHNKDKTSDSVPKKEVVKTTSTPKKATVKENKTEEKASVEKKSTEPKSQVKNSPEQIALGMKNIIHGYFKSIKSDSFKNLIADITPANVADVMEAYDKLGTGETLINAITSEFGSSKDYRKELVMDLYNKAAKAGSVDANAKAEFKAELDEQFDSWGMVDTEKLDKMMNLAMGKQGSVGKSSSTSKKGKADLRKVNLTKNSNTYTVSELQRGAIKSAKEEALTKFKDFCEDNKIAFSEDKLDLGPIDRIPPPVVENGQIVPFESEIMKPTVPPNGKVVIINPGHGAYSSRTGYFDPGSYSFIKKGNGKYAPLLEGDKMKIYADATAEKLRAKGYAVVITGFHIQTAADQSSVKNLITELQNGDKGNKKYSTNDISFISLHADSGTPEQKNTAVCYDKAHQNDIDFANTLNDNLNSKENDDWVKSELSERNWSEKGKGLQVLFQSQTIPSVLVEVEYVNGASSKNLDSSAFQNRFIDKIINGLNEYYGFNQDK